MAVEFKSSENMEDLTKLISLISETQSHFRQQAQRQVNTANLPQLAIWLLTCRIRAARSRQGCLWRETDRNAIKGIDKKATERIFGHFIKAI